MKKHLHLVLGLLVAAVALYFTFREVSLADIFLSIKGFRYQYLPSAVALFLGSFVLRVYRWRYLCLPVKDVPSRRLYSPMMIGFMGNLLPLRAGEFIRAYLLGKREDLGFSAALGTIVVERLLDLIAVLALFAGLLVLDPLVFVPHSGEADPQIAAAVRTFGFLSLGMSVGLALFLYFLVHHQERTLGLVRFFSRALPGELSVRMEEILKSFTVGLGVLRDPKAILVALLLSALLWGVILFGYYPIYFCYGIEAMMPLSSLITLLVLVCASTMIPTPGYVGPFQFAITFALADLYGVDRSVAASFSLVTWFLQMGLIFLAGIFFILRDNISFFELSRTAKQMAEGGEGEGRDGM